VPAPGRDHRACTNGCPGVSTPCPDGITERARTGAWRCPLRARTGSPSVHERVPRRVHSVPGRDHRACTSGRGGVPKTLSPTALPRLRGRAQPKRHVAVHRTPNSTTARFLRDCGATRAAVVGYRLRRIRARGFHLWFGRRPRSERDRESAEPRSVCRCGAMGCGTSGCRALAVRRESLALFPDWIQALIRAAALVWDRYRRRARWGAMYWAIAVKVEPSPASGGGW
jgi:hypothetical protein